MFSEIAANLIERGAVYGAIEPVPCRIDRAALGGSEDGAARNRPAVARSGDAEGECGHVRGTLGWETTLECARLSFTGHAKARRRGRIDAHLGTLPWSAQAG